MRTIAFIALLLAASVAQAQAYVFGNFSQTKATTRTAADTSGTDYSTMQLGGGYRFSRYLAAEASYLGLGHYDAPGGSWTASGFGAAAVGTMPLSDAWSLIGKAGFYRLESELAVCCTTVTKTKLGSRPAFAAGVDYHVGDALHVQALVQQIKGKTGSDLDNIKMLSIGAVLAF